MRRRRKRDESGTASDRPLGPVLARLPPSDRTCDDRSCGFGQTTTKSVAISAGGDRAAITVETIQFDARVERGSATVHERVEDDGPSSTSPKWRAAARLVPSDGRLAWFGWSVAVRWDVAVIGRPTKSGPSYNNAVYAYRRNPSDGGWTEAALLQPREGPTRGRSFGWSLSVSSYRTVAVGAKDDGGGSVYAFRPSPVPLVDRGGPDRRGRLGAQQVRFPRLRRRPVGARRYAGRGVPVVARDVDGGRGVRSGGGVRVSARPIDGGVMVPLLPPSGTGMGLCNPLKNPERYLELGGVSRRVSDFGRNAGERNPFIIDPPCPL